MKLLRSVVFVGLLIVFGWGQFVGAQGEARLYLSAENLTLTIGQEITVEMLVEHLPAIYGADVQVIFDPNALAVVDANPAEEGIQIAYGAFLYLAEQHIPMRNIANNEAGHVNLAFTRRNPAPPAEGSGVLGSITFRAKTDGDTVIYIERGELGTQTGAVIPLILDGVMVQIDERLTQPTATPEPTVETVTPVPTDEPIQIATSVPTVVPDKIAQNSSSSPIESDTVEIEENGADLNRNALWIGLAIGLSLFALAAISIFYWQQQTKTTVKTK